MVTVIDVGFSTRHEGQTTQSRTWFEALLWRDLEACGVSVAAEQQLVAVVRAGRAR
jgi:hypothetical protein